MKKLLSVVLILLFSVSIYSQEFSNPEDLPAINFSEAISFEKSFMVTHSLSQIIDPGTSVSCNSGGIHYENSYYRVFDLEKEFNINGDWLVQNVEFGIDAANSGTGNSQPVNIILYVMSEYNNSIIKDSLTQKGDTLKFDVNNNESGTLKIVEVSPNVNVNLGQVLVVEVWVPNGQDEGHSFFIGSNDLGETDSTYIQAGDCGVDDPIPMSELLFPDMHLVMNLLGVYEDPTPEILSFNIEGQITETEIINDPDWKVNIVMSVEAELNALSPTITIPAGFQVIPASEEEVDFSLGSVTYEVNNEYGKVSQTWEVSVTNAGPDILDVQISGQNGETVINNENYTVTVPVPIGTDLTNLTPVITIYEDEGFTIEPESGVSQDFSSGPVIYTVSHETLPLSQDWEITVYEAVAGIKDLIHKEIKIYPNPANDILKTDLNNIEKIEIFDINGNLMIFDLFPEYINISDLSEGVYIIRIYTEKSIYTERLIIIH
ncbi:MAG: T9SS type A sorting domain-containing protein [Bacteroidales bacterium]|nr:T9SS type A sorting domain-containing protein [Bacteroidales bacterium]